MKKLNIKEADIAKLEIRIIPVTPQMAQSWLDNNPINRKIYESTWRRYGNDMTANRWGLAEAAIFIGRDGSLYNGQHRCMAIVHSGVTVPMIVVTGCTPDMVKNIDQGKSRSSADAIKLGYGEDAPGWKIACARYLSCGDQRIRSHHELRDWMVEFEAEMGFLQAHPRIPKLSFAVFDAVVCRALRAGHNRDRISEWMSVCHTSIPRDRMDNAAIKYRDWAMSANTAGYAGREEAHDRCQYALAHFLLRKPIDRLLATSGELFRIGSTDKKADNASLEKALHTLLTLATVGELFRDVGR